MSRLTDLAGPIAPKKKTFERLPDKVDWPLHSNFSDKPVTDAAKRIVDASRSVGISPFNPSTIPYLKGPYCSGRRLVVSKFVQGEDRCMMRDAGRNDPSRASGVRIFVQLAAINWEKHDSVLDRAIAALAVAERVRSDGRPVEVIATWAVVGDADESTIHVPWRSIEAVSAEQLAKISDPTFFRTTVVGWWESGRSNHGGCIGRMAGYPIVDFADYREAVRSLHQPGDVVIDWGLPSVSAQIANGLEQV